MIAVVFNPTARGEKAEAFHRQLRQLGDDVQLLPTTAAGDATRLAVEAGRAGARIVAAAGGDGTVNEVVNGLASLPVSGRPALGVLPLGTINVFAKELGLGQSLAACWDVIRRGTRRRIDLAVATHGSTQRWFVQMAGAGLDAAAISRVQWHLKKRLGPLAYLWAGIGALAGPLPRIRVCVEGPGQTEELSGQLALVGNGRFYGGRLPVFSSANLQDGLLDLALLPSANVLSLARAALALRSGRLLQLSGILHRQARAFSFHADGPAPFHVEGDNIGFLPARFSIQPAALEVVIPSPEPEPAIDSRPRAGG